MDHSAPVYKAGRDGIIATLGQVLNKDTQVDSYFGGTQVYIGNKQYRLFPSTISVDEIVKMGYSVLGYESPLFETYLYYDGHDGHDFAAVGDALAAADGLVVYQGTMGTFGKVVEIYHSQGYLTRYAHLASFAENVKVGTDVKAGQTIGRIGGSGVEKEGNIKEDFWPIHLHFSVYRWNASFSRWNVVDPFGWDTFARTGEEDSLELEKGDPLFACNGEISYNLWVDGWPHRVNDPIKLTFQNPTGDRYLGGWFGDLPEYPEIENEIAFIRDGSIWIMSDIGLEEQQLVKLNNPKNSDWITNIYWSPDGKKIAFPDYSNQMEFIIINADGSDHLNLSDYQPARIDQFSDLSWSPDSQFVAFTHKVNDRYDIFTVKNDGSNLVNITKNSVGGYYYYIAWSPDGSQMAFMSNVPKRQLLGESGIFEDLYVMNLSDMSMVNLTNLPDNELQNLRIHGTAAFPTKIRWSPKGDLITFVGLPQGSTYCGAMGTPADCKEVQNIFITKADGTSITNLTGPEGSEGRYDWSPDGKRIAFETNRNGNSEIYLINTDASGLINLTNNSAEDTSPSWSPDGESIVFVSNRDGNQELYRIDLNSGSQIRITHSEGNESLPAYRPVNLSESILSPVSTPTANPSLQDIDLTNPIDVITWFSNGIKFSDIQFFEKIFTEDTLLYGTGLAMEGGRDVITKEGFFQELEVRLANHHPTCVGYSVNPEGNFLMIWTQGWDPKWNLLGKPTSDVLTFSLSLQNGNVFITAYFTPAPAILSLPNIKSLPCP
ncbi:MAG: peptidoglycan DD-metalloendopeptidase family protein [Anaerolineaceae bacterium]|nr:peptidoglycan DD-metalloendopeptidase family protein [Anaerolineaceae bacterium]